MKKPSIDELKNEFLKNFYANAPNTESKNSISIETILAYSVAGLIYLLWGLIDGYYKELFIQTSTGERLDYWANIVSLSRKQSTKASGELTFTGVDGSVIPLGTKIQTSTGIIFLTDKEVTISAGTVNVSVTAESVGALGNTAKGDDLVLINNIVGIDKTVVIHSDGLSDGNDVETDSGYRKRIEEAFKIRSVGGNRDDYIKWTKSIPGVDKVFLMNQYGLSNGIAVMILQDNDDPMPSPTLLEKVQSYLDEESIKPYTDEVFVLNSDKNVFTKDQMKSIPVHFEIELDLKRDATESVVKQAITNGIKDFLRREAEPYVDMDKVDYTGTYKKVYYLTDIQNIITNTEGVRTHDIKAPSTSFSVISLGGNRFDVVTFGGITWT